MIRYTPEEKMEIIHLVEHSELPVKQTLEKVQVPRSTFYDWYQRYQELGPEGLKPKASQKAQFWNRIPDPVRTQVANLALEHPEETPRQMARQRLLEQHQMSSAYPHPLFQITSFQERRSRDGLLQY